MLRIFGSFISILQFGFFTACGNKTDTETADKSGSCTLIKGAGKFCVQHEALTATQQTNEKTGCDTWTLQGYTATFSTTSLCEATDISGHGTCKTSDGRKVIFYSGSYSSANISASCSALGATYTAG